ncbi:zf-HC2 domain-containing protein [Aquisphaera insulae]|uniref:zf-HC2 domain-containing protein n=1 Tax=Aquisphaera insulae TaxID=2712864 RepID=UPI0013EA0D6C|nr:zf-HC2 domain-containing protein [Aquisphaera insulae]
MVETDKGVNMGRSCCEWVRERLPLLVEDADGVAAEGCEVSAADRARIDQHLAGCAGCRSRRESLGRAMSILGAIAAEPWAPVMAAGHAPSVLAGVEDRIRRQQAEGRAWWRRLWRGACPEGVRGVIDRACGRARLVRDELPLQLAWSRDTLAEAFTRRADRAASRLRDGLDALESARLNSHQARHLRLGFGLAMGLGMIAGLVAIATADRARTAAEVRIAAAAVPLPRPERPSVVSEDVVTAAAALTDLHASNSLVQARPTLSAAAEGPSTAGSRPTGTATAAATAATSSSPSMQYAFDLEHGTPMPPEARGGKPAY